MQKRGFNNFALGLKLQPNHYMAWVLSSKFAAYLQNTFFEEQLRRSASQKKIIL